MKKILLVEDEPMLQVLIADILEASLNCRVIPVGDAFEAFNTASQEKFDLIISDYQMPYVDGLTFVRAMRDKPLALNNATPVLILSGSNSPGLPNSQFPSIRFLAKPPQFDTLIQNVNELLDTPIPNLQVSP